MRAISLWRPWAELVICGIKPVENRTWETPYRGYLAIHAAKKFDYDWVDKLPVGCAILAMNHFNSGVPAELSPSGLVGVVNLSCCTKGRMSKWHDEGCWGWYLESPHRFKKEIDYRGRQGLFDVPLSIVAGAMLQ